MHRMSRNRPAVIFAVVLGLLVLVLFWAGRISGGRIDEDGAHTLTMAVNLAHSGVMSLGQAPPLAPTMYREPLPALVAAAAVIGIDAVQGRADMGEYFAGPRARLVKFTNLPWMLLMTVGVYAAIVLFSSSPALGAIGALLVNVPLPLMPSGLRNLGIDSLNSDLPAAALLVTGSALLAAGLVEPRPWRAAAAGVTFGALALVKASFLYVFVGIVVSAAVVCLAVLRHDRRRAAVVNVAILTVCFASVVAPWMARNHQAFGTYSIAERGGIVLLIRAVKDRMSAEEYRGAFYAWAPPALKPVIGPMLGFGPRDLQRGGPLQRLNRYPSADFHADDVAAERAGRPDLAISYYRQARAQRQQLYDEIGATLGSSEVDRRLQERALGMIGEQPLRHLATTVPFLWRGAFVAFPVLVVGLFVAWRYRDLKFATLLWPSLGLVLFYGLLSHFIPRYGLPVVPIIIVAALLLPGRARRARRGDAGLNAPSPDQAIGARWR